MPRSKKGIVVIRLKGMMNRLGAVCIGLGMLTACTQPRVPDDNYYRLIADPPVTSPSQARLPGVLQVDRMQADGITAGRNLAYSETGNESQLKEYHYHFWTEPPTIMLQEQLVAYLRAAKIADQVVTASMRVTPNYVLVGKIRRLEKIKGANPRGVLEMELGLTKEADGSIVVLDTYRVEVDAADDSVIEGVDALNAALTAIVDRFVKDIPTP